jgi:hypothetical protein
MADPEYIGTGGLAAALAQGERLLRVDPAGAEAQAREILAVTPGCSAAYRLSARALRRLGRAADAERAECDAAYASAREPLLAAAAKDLQEGRWQEAEVKVRRRIDEAPDDPNYLQFDQGSACEDAGYAQDGRPHL